MADLLAVESSSIEAIGYDAGRRELYVQFRDNPALYAYQDVPPEVFDQLLAAESKGRFVNSEIKPRYLYTKLPRA